MATGDRERYAGSVLELLAGIQESVIVVDLNQLVVLMNPAAAALLGARADDANGERCYNVVGLFREDGSALCQPDCPAIILARRGIVPPSRRLSLTDSEGRARWLLAFHLVLPPSLKYPLGLLVHVFHERTQEVEARATLQQIRDILAASAVGSREEAPQARVPPGAKELTRREIEAIRLVAEGLGTGAIAQKMGLSPKTVRGYLYLAVAKLGAHSRLQAVNEARRLGLL